MTTYTLVILLELDETTPPMTDYDKLFAETTPTDSVFVQKRALDPLIPPDEVVARGEQERALARILNGIHEEYLPTTVSIYGPPGTGKTMTSRRVCQEFVTRRADLAVEYINLKECRTLFSVANEILFELTGTKKQAYEGLDGVFEALWNALEAYPEYTVLLLDEIDHVRHERNYDPSEFFYRLLRGEGKLKRGLNVSVWMLSNQLLEVDLQLDSRVQSVMSGEQVFFPPYSQETLLAILTPRLDRAFSDGALPEDVIRHGVWQAARRWGDARKALTLFRHAGELANERGLSTVTEACIDDSLGATDKEAITEKLLGLPFNHFHVLIGVTGWTDRPSGEIIQPVTTEQIAEITQNDDYPAKHQVGDRAIREIIQDLELMGLVETWVESRGREGRVKQIETTFEPQWVQDMVEQYIQETDQREPLQQRNDRVR